MVFMGEEWGAGTPWQFFSHFPDAQLRDNIREGRFAEFADHGWADIDVPDPNEEQTFLRSKLDWDELGREPHDTLHRTYRDLIALRRSHPELSDPWLHRSGVDADERARTMVLHRGGLRVAVNLGAAETTVWCHDTVGRVLLASGEASIEGGRITLPAESFAVVEMRA